MKPSKTKKFLEMCEQKGINPETVDVDSMFDNKLTSSENWANVERVLGQSPQPMPDGQYEDYVKGEIREFNKKQDIVTANIEDYYKPIRLAIEKISNGFENLALIQSRAGLGKTTWIKHYLIQMGLWDNVDVAVDCSEAYFIEMLWNNRNGGVCWIKDIVRLLKNQNILDNLKSATEDDVEDRVITNYNYSRYKGHIERKFIFKGSFIFDYNEIYENRFKADFEALRSRGTYVNLALHKRDIDNIMRKIAKKEWEKKVTDFLIKNYQYVGHQEYNLRTQHNAFMTYLNSTKMKRDWKKDLLYELKYNMSPVRSMLWEFMGKQVVTTTELKRWLVKSGRVGCLRTADRKVKEYLELEEVFRVTENKYDFGLCLFPKNCDNIDRDMNVNMVN